MSKHYIYKMRILENDTYHGVYIGQHKLGSKEPCCDGYKGSGSKWKELILKNHIPVEKTILRICDDIYETNRWEEYYIEQAILSGEYLWNVNKGGGGHEGVKVYTDDEIKAHNKARFNKWYESHKEYYSKYRKQYLTENKDRIYEKKREYEKSHSEYYRQYRKEYYERNKVSLSKAHKQYYEQNKERLNETRKEYYRQYAIDNVKELSRKHRAYNNTHKEDRERYYSQPCCYEGETLTFRALILRLRRKGVSNPTEKAKQFLIKEML